MGVISLFLDLGVGYSFEKNYLMSIYSNMQGILFDYQFIEICI
jgi:hypothetical protein